MPHAPRLDAPGVLYHVMARDIEQHSLFRDNHDRDDFLRRLAALAAAGALAVYAWALMPNHYLVLWPRKDGEMTEFLRWLTHTLGLTS